jgi:DNA-binding IclR family transcriptional regulator
MPLLDEPQQRILSLLTGEPEGISIDAIGARAALPAGEVARCLLDLELKGLVRSLPGRVYIRSQESA